MISVSNSIFALFLFLFLTSLVSSDDEEGHFVSLRGKKQYVLVDGKGEPTVVFLTGKGREYSDFKKVYAKIKKNNRIFAYDRAGIGGSQTLRNQRTIDTMAFELNALLLKEKIKPPYIFVGHSLGTYIIRCFATMYPGTVAGMVFINPAHENEYNYSLSVRNDSAKTAFKEEMESYLKLPGRTKGHNEESKYCFDFDSLGFSTNQYIVKKQKQMTDIPVHILISTTPDVDNEYIDKEIENTVQFFESWKNFNPQVKVTSTPKGGYFIHMTEPAMVADEINEVIGKVKK
jgi:pimeloyl-ACP methyl ester carboxylesterase